MNIRKTVMSSTPKILWQTWKSDKLDDVPEKLKGYILKWKKLHPEYAHYLLDDDDLRNIVKKVVPKYLNVYDSFTHMIERVDFARYAILYKYGGVYADLDTLPLKPIDKWVEEGKIVLGSEPYEHAQKIYNRERVVCNALMISPPGQQFWKELMDYIIRNYEHRYKPVENTGPMAITRFMESDGKKFEKNGDVIVTDPCVFYPLKSDNKPSDRCNLNDSYVMHVWENTWVSKWYQDPMWFNRRYWTYGLSVLVVVMIIYYLMKK